MNIHLPSTPAHLRITQTMWEDLLFDPVKAATVIMGFELDAFQAARLRYYWFSLEVIDSSGFSSAKTVIDWIVMNLRCTLLPGRQVVAWYYTFDQMKRTFWKYYKTCPGKIWRAQLGGTDERGDEQDTTSRGASCYIARYKNGSQLEAPATNVAQDSASQSSTRYHDGLIEEWTHMDASGSEAIEKQLKGRITMETFNQHHPIWGNHILLTAPAKTRAHPGHHRFSKFSRMVAKGDPRRARLHYSYKDYSNVKTSTGRTFRQRFRVESTIESLRASMSPAEFLGEGLGHWGANGKGWFTGEAIEAAQARGLKSGLVPVLSRAQYEAALKDYDKAVKEETGITE